MNLPQWLINELNPLVGDIKGADKEIYDQAMLDLAEYLQLLLTEPDQTERWQQDIEHIYGTLANIGVLTESVTRTHIREQLTASINKLFSIALRGLV